MKTLATLSFLGAVLLGCTAQDSTTIGDAPDVDTEGLDPLAALAAVCAGRPGERIGFLGDSITESGNASGGYVDRIRAALAADERSRPTAIIPVGISGNRVPDLLARLDADLLEHRPTLVWIYIGINDVWRSLSGGETPAAEFESGLVELIERCRRAGAKVVLATPSVIGEKTDGSNPLDGMLDDYAAISRRVASAEGVGLCDLRAAFLAHLREVNGANAESGVLTTDGVHLNEAGNRFVAEQCAQALAESLRAR